MKEMFEGQGSPPDVSVRGENMLAPDEVAAMVRLKSLGWGTRKIAAALGCSRTTVKRYVEVGGFVAYRQPRRGRRLDGSITGWRNASGSIAAMPRWCARTWRAS